MYNLEISVLVIALVLFLSSNALHVVMAINRIFRVKGNTLVNFKNQMNIEQKK